MRNIIFDFDGPLFDGRGAAKAALEATFEHYSEDLSAADAAAAEQLPLLPPRALLAALLAQNPRAMTQLDEIEARYRQVLAQHEAGQGLWEGMPELLAELQGLGWGLAILSSRRHEDLLEKLRRNNVENLFHVVHGRDSLVHPKPSGKALQQVLRELSELRGQREADGCIMVGDSDHDFHTTRANGAAYYHAAWSGEPCHRAATEATERFDSPNQLREVLVAAPRSVNLANSDRLPREMLAAITASDLRIFAGAGVSVPSGFGNWNDHYLPVLRQLEAEHLAEDRELELTELLQLLVADEGRAQRVFDEFRDSFHRPGLRPNGYHYALLRTGAARIWTSNYDELFEEAINYLDSDYRTVYDDPSLSEHFRSRRLVVKINGDFRTATYDRERHWNLVFTQEQLDLADRRRPEIWRLFEDDYRNRCLLFIGTSFTDAALRRIVAGARRRITRTRYPHYLLTRSAWHPAAQRKQMLQAESLEQVSIRTLFFNDFGSIMDFVAEVARRCTRPVVAFSGSSPGSADDRERLEGGQLSTEELRQLGRNLGQSLARRGYRIASGAGPGVGIPPVQAAFEAEPSSARFYLRAQGGHSYRGEAPAIVVPGTAKDGNAYDAMRERLLGEASLMLLLGGRIKQVDRSGTVRELRRAQELGLPALIVPQAGGMAGRLLQDHLANLDRNYPDRELADCMRSAQEAIQAAGTTELAAVIIEQIENVTRIAMTSRLAVANQPRHRRSW